MKSLSLCLILVLSLLLNRSLGTTMRENEIINSADHLTLHQTQESEVQASLSRSRSRRHTPLSICLFCCNCCKYKGCGYCCRT